MVLGQLGIHMVNCEPGHPKKYLKVDHKPKIRATAKRLLKENIEEEFCELRLGKS